MTHRACAGPAGRHEPAMDFPNFTEREAWLRLISATGWPVAPRLADEKRARVKRRGRKVDDSEPDWLSANFRIPPAPYRERRFARGAGFCCICGQPVYRFGWHVDLWDGGTNRNAVWHAACVVAWDLWTAPSDYARVLRRLQQRRCAETGQRLWKTA